MGNKKGKNTHFNENEIESIDKTDSINEGSVKDPVSKKESLMTLNKYLTDYSKYHNVDNVIKHWYSRKEVKTVVKTKDEWDKIIEDFFKQEAK
jgi:hypothetical protein